MEKKIFGGILAGSLIAVGGFVALMVLGLGPLAAAAYIGGLAVAVGLTYGLALLGGFDPKWGIKIAYGAGFAVTTLIPIAAVVSVLQAREAAEREEILANQDQQTVTLYGEAQKLAGRETVLGGEDATLIAEEAKRAQALIEAQQLAADLAAGQGEDVKAWKEAERRRLIAQPRGLIGWAKQKVGIEDAPANASTSPKSFAEDLLSVPWWQATFFLVFIVMGAGGIGTWLVVTSFVNTILGKGVDKVKEGLEDWKYVRAWAWYIFDRFVVRWAGKFAAVAMVIYVVVATRAWYFPDHPLPGSAMWRAQQTVAAAQTTPAPVVTPPVVEEETSPRRKRNGGSTKKGCNPETVAFLRGLEAGSGSDQYTRAGLKDCPK